MTANYELPKDTGDDQPLDEKLQVLFDTVLNETADQLEPFCTADETIFVTKDAAFGRFSEDKLTLSHTVKRIAGIEPKHYGIITYVDASDSSTTRNPDDEKKSFVVKYIPEYSKLWVLPDDTGYRSYTIVSMLEDIVPFDDTASRDAILRLLEVEADAADQKPEIPPQDIFVLLENYSILRGTGQHTYTMKWNYSGSGANPFDVKACSQTIDFSIISDQKDSLRTVTMDVSMELTGYKNPVTYHVSSDEFGNVTISADTVNAETKSIDNVPIEDPERLFNTSKLMLEELVRVKVTLRDRA